MSSALFRLGRFSFRHKWWVIGTWVALLAIMGGLVAGLNPKFAKDFELPGTDGGIAMEQMQEKFPALSEQQMKARTTVVIAADDGLAAHTAQIETLTTELAALPSVTDPKQIVDPVLVAQSDPAMASQVLSDDGKIGLISVGQDIDLMELEPADKQALLDVLERNSGNGLQVEATSGVMGAMSGGGTAEALGFGVAFVVMIVAFGALIAAFIPLITGIVGVGLTMLMLMVSASFMTVNQAATGIVLMLGIAVSIDYALFIVSRFRNEVQRGGSPADAAGRAVGTAGTAVVFAGLTVIIAVVALMVIGIPLITQMGMGAAVAVLVAVLSAITLIPAILGAVGRFAFTPRIPWIRHAEPSDDVDTLGVKFGRAIVAKPIPFIVVGLAILVAAAIPVKGMELGLDMTADDEIAAQQLVKKGFGEGINGQLFVVVAADDDADVAPAAERTVADIKKLPDVYQPESVAWMGNGTDPANPNAGANTALIVVTPLSSPSSTETHDLMESIRALSPTLEQQRAQLHVGGQTAIMSDLSTKLDKALIPYIAVVVGLAFLIMIAVFRSIWVPLIGTIGFVFSVLATFGITTAVFTDGWLGLIENPRPLLSFLPIFLVGVVFGLAMDYQVFLVTRMREEFLHGMSPKDAIVAGYRHGGRVVTSAAIIMISVFAAFMLSPETTNKMLGFALAIAVFFDAFIIRMIVVPAVISLLGEKAWGLPRWLDKLVLNFDVEGSSVRHRGVGTTAEEEVALT
ncbi:MMPL family transporter [Gordonia alkaliphila]|uniref:MMPL family transporter n=1 Tax=Gordonia alkaliphila TaxID=1053547 RepID=A0ABP8ZCL0_9ACTN|nr:MMPL family transporter [Gordonia alkaliphila]MCK0439841.1 MMPL family transporter [Gordonia alkaliphila]